MIEARGISKVFPPLEKGGDPFTALNSVSLTIRDGEFVSLVGPSGCGKSTLLEILAGLQAPSSGEVRINGRLVLDAVPTGATERDCRSDNRFISPISNGLFRDRSRHDIAMIFQDYAVLPWMTARQNVLFTLKLRGVPKGEREKAALRYLRSVHLEDAADSYPSRMSGGMRQRLALARALSVEPKIILMDEPFAAVDALTRMVLRDELLQVWESSGACIVLVTHDVDEAIYLSDEIHVISPSPGTIAAKIAVDIRRPRRRNSPESILLREQIYSVIGQDRGC